MPNLPRVTASLLVANVLVYLLQQSGGGDGLLVNFALWPLGPGHVESLGHGSFVRIGFEPWQLITYSFLHGSTTHILFNMLALWMFGGPVENVLGERRFAIFYFACVLGAACADRTESGIIRPASLPGRPRSCRICRALPHRCSLRTCWSTCCNKLAATVSW